MRTRVENLFHEVADLPPDDRARYLSERGIDGVTQREVDALLAFDTRSSDSVDLDISCAAKRALEQFEPAHLACGPYRLGELLGRGGMGAVYLAERVDGEVTQRVAVKLLRPGADAPELRHRFLAERQILATLSHPNIARLLDAGHREDGQPYLVMEHVEGSAIDAYAAGLPLRRKLGLFLKVCAAVGYLHRNLVVHRDLKPANILVTDEGEPKLLDFGIAKMLDLTNDSTVTALRMLTPDYASPEQVTGEPVGVATDVYSLGAVLYKLLTGVSPHRLDGDSGAAVASVIVAGKITPPGKLAPALRGDLEIILMKALRREPQERYASVEQFADDIENHLEFRPIRARKGERWYQARKYLRRHWLTVAAAMFAASGLTAGMIVANHQRAIAERRFVQVRQLANQLFDIDVEVRKVPGTTKARDLIARTALEYLRRVSAEVHGDPELALEVGNAYMRVGRVQGVPIANNLGQMDQAEEDLRIAEGFIHSVLATEPSNRTAMLRAAQIAHDRMLLARLSGHSDLALSFAHESAKWLDKFQAGKGDVHEAAAILNTYLNVADQHLLREKYDDALRISNHGVDVSRTLGSRSYLGTFHWVSAEVFRRRGDLEAALNEIRESVKNLDFGPERADQDTKLNFVFALIREGRILGETDAISLGRSDEAVEILERAFQIADTFVHKDGSDQSSRGRLAMAGLLLGDILRNSDPQRSLATYEHVFNHMTEVKNNSSFRRFEVSALTGSSYPLLRLGRTADAAQRLDAAFARLHELKLHPAVQIQLGSEAAKTVAGLADYQAGRGKVSEAIDTYTDLTHKILAAQPEPETNLIDAVNMSHLYAALAALHVRAGHISPAAEMEERRRELWRHWDSQLPQNSFVHRQLEAANRRGH